MGTSALSVLVTGHPEILEIEGQFTKGSSFGRTLGESVVGFSKLTVLIGIGIGYWLDGIRYHTFGTRPDTEFKLSIGVTCHPYLLESEGPVIEG